MKKLILVAAVMVATVGALAQATDGTVLFKNKVGAAGIDAPVFGTDGKTKLAGSDYLVQLYAGKDANSLAAVGSATAFLTGAGAGYFSGGTVTIASLAQGAVGSFQVKAWAASGGASYEAAKAKGAAIGASAVFTATTGGDLATPPLPPGNLVGLTSFSLAAAAVPEPTTIALGLLGAAALMLRRRS